MAYKGQEPAQCNDPPVSYVSDMTLQGDQLIDELPVAMTGTDKPEIPTLPQTVPKELSVVSINWKAIFVDPIPST